MKGDYPRFKATYTHDELVEHFLLSPADHAMVETCYGDANRHSVAVLLKSLHYLGYFPSNFQQVPPEVRTFIAQQLQLLWDCTAEYPWHSRTRDRHLALIRSRAGFRFPTSADKQALEAWLQTQGARESPTEEDLCECAYARLRAWGIELPTEPELRRMVRAGHCQVNGDLRNIKVQSGTQTAFGSQHVATSGRSNGSRQPKYFLSGSGFSACRLT
jgi:hypothetical protein